MEESKRQKQLVELIKKLSSEFLNLESNKTSLITITDASISKDFRRATIFFTVFPESSEESALNFTKRKRTEFKTYFKNHSKIRQIPMFDFAIDLGEKNRQKIDELSIKN